MHSRIFGIVDLDYYNTKDFRQGSILDHYEDYLPDFADYVSGAVDINEDFDWLITSLIHSTDSSLIEFDKNNLTIKFKSGFKEKYFQEKWDNLIKTLIGNPNSFNAFCGLNKNVDFSYNLKKLISTEFEFYVSDDYGSYETLDDFIRSVSYDKEYKVFDCVDYHY